MRLTTVHLAPRTRLWQCRSDWCFINRPYPTRKVPILTAPKDNLTLAIATRAVASRAIFMCLAESTGPSGLAPPRAPSRRPASALTPYPTRCRQLAMCFSGGSRQMRWRERLTENGCGPYGLILRASSYRVGPTKLGRYPIALSVIIEFHAPICWNAQHLIPSVRPVGCWRRRKSAYVRTLRL